MAAQVLFRGQQLGKYEVLDSLGTGGFASVYLARDQWINKMVALKIPHYQNYDMEHLLKEPRMLARLNHPNIIGILSAEKETDLFFFVMEYVEGESLEEFAGTRKDTSPEISVPLYSANLRSARLCAFTASFAS